ncbi:MAG TPA: hypothetical protein VJR47_09985 [Stellaceae bacterium]|nr:hypothetical protein [Stellaceae bacterium]
MAKQHEPTVVRVTPPESLKGELKRLGGSKSDAFNNVVLNQAISSLWLAHSDEETRQNQYTAALMAIAGFKPQDELEGMLAAQAVAIHNAAMECYRRAMLSEQTFEGRRESLNQGGKLSRSYALLLEALDKHRGKGQQTVRVEHVTVQAGGQAIVGNVASSGGGGTGKSEDQPHAKQLTHAPDETLPSQIEAQREAVPSTSGQRLPSLPHAWRARRRPERQSKCLQARSVHGGRHRAEARGVSALALGAENAG